MRKTRIIYAFLFIVGAIQKIEAKEKQCSDSTEITIAQKPNTGKKYNADMLALIEAIEANHKDYDKLLEDRYKLQEASVEILPKLNHAAPARVRFILIAREVQSLNALLNKNQGERKLILERTEDQEWRSDSPELPNYDWKSSGVLPVKK